MTTQTTNGIDPSKAEQRAERAVQNVAEQDAAKNNTSLAVLSGKLVNFEPQSATETWLLAQYFFAAKSMLPARLGSVGDVFMTLMAGRSLGLDAMTAIRGIDCVEGKVFIEGDLVHAMLLSRLKAEDGEYVELLESTDKGATYEFMKKGWKKPKQGTFNEEDARKAGLLDKKGPWQSYRKAMFRHRAMVTWGREYFPQWFLGVYTNEEREEFGRDVNARPGAGVIPATKAPTEVDVAPTQPGPSALPAPSPKVHLEEAKPAEAVVANPAAQAAVASAPRTPSARPATRTRCWSTSPSRTTCRGSRTPSTASWA
jgi:hypothetical protein